MKKSNFNKKSRLKFNIATNLVICFLITSIGFACLYPGNDIIQTDGTEENVYRCSPVKSDGVSLMFNVYWGTEEVYRILDILEKNNGKATFFIGGSWADDNVKCVKDILSAGHEIGNHGYFHKNHSKLSLKENINEISICNQFLHLTTGKEPELFAPPSGAYDKNTLSACKTLNMKTILWSKDTIDWRDKNSAIIYSRATKNIYGGEFILMHPMKETADALDDILKFYQSKSLKVVTVSENLHNGG